MTSNGYQVGTVLADLVAPAITRETLARYAGAAGDYSSIHIDIDQARAVGFDDVIAHGMLSMAYLGRLLTDNFPQQALRSYKVRFTAVTPVHAQPTCSAVVREVVDGGHEQRVVLDLAVVLPDGKVTLRGEALLALMGA